MNLYENQLKTMKNEKLHRFFSLDFIENLYIDFSMKNFKIFRFIILRFDRSIQSIASINRFDPSIRSIDSINRFDQSIQSIDRSNRQLWLSFDWPVPQLLAVAAAGSRPRRGSRRCRDLCPNRLIESIDRIK